MKRLLPFVFCLFFLIACEKEEVGIPEVQTQYVLKEIQYSLGEGDGIQEELEDLLPRVVENRTSGDIRLTVHDMENLKEQFLFKSGDPNAFLLAESDSIMVQTPSLISGETIITSKNHFYIDSLQYGAPSKLATFDAVVKPHQIMYMKIQVKWQVMTVTYVVVYEDTGLEKRATGKWIGKTYLGYDVSYTLEDLV